jgi:hypothetical protein
MLLYIVGYLGGSRRKFDFQKKKAQLISCQCRRGGPNAAGRVEQEVEDRALTSMRASPPHEGAPRSGHAPSRLRRRRS